MGYYGIGILVCFCFGFSFRNFFRVGDLVVLEVFVVFNLKLSYFFFFWRVVVERLGSGFRCVFIVDMVIKEYLIEFLSGFFSIDLVRGFFGLRKWRKGIEIILSI